MSDSTKKPVGPEIAFFVRTSTEVHFRTGPIKKANQEGLKSNLVSMPAFDDVNSVYSPCGKFVAVALKACVRVLDTQQEHKEVCVVNRPNIVELHWSPKSTFLVTYERKVSREDPHNLNAWRVSDGSRVLQWKQKELRDSVGKKIAWTEDEALCAHLVPDALRFYDGANPNMEEFEALQLKGVRQFSLASGREGKQLKYRVATFCPGLNQGPAKVAVYEHPRFAQGESTATKSFFKADDCVLRWSPTGDNVLIQCTTERAQDDSSYYGESLLALLSHDGKTSMNVSFEGNKGPVQAAEWAPTGRDFMVVQGYQPAKCTLFLARDCTAVRCYGQGPFNGVTFSPHGRFVCLHGTGNLAGEFEFWDKNKFKKLGVCRCHGTTEFGFAPDGRSFFTAVTRPRRKVENRFLLWSYAGEEIYKEDIDKLCQVSFQAAPPSVYPDRPVSPRLNKKALAALQVSQAPKQYVPPHMRNKQGGATKSTSLNDRRVAAPSKIYNARPVQQQQAPQQHLPVGMSAPVQPVSAPKRRRRRNRGKGKNAEEGEEPAPEAKEEAKKEAAPAKTDDPQKAIRKLNKVLKAIAALKEKQAAGSVLQPDQVKKVSTEASVQAELKALMDSV